MLHFTNLVMNTEITGSISAPLMWWQRSEFNFLNIKEGNGYKGYLIGHKVTPGHGNKWSIIFKNMF